MAVTLQNRYARIVIGDDGTVESFRDSVTSTDWVFGLASAPWAIVLRGGTKFPATGVQRVGDSLVLDFAGADAKACVQVVTRDAYFVFTVIAIEGEIDELDFINIPTTLRVIADEPFSAGVLALNLQTNVEELPGPQEHLWAGCYRRFGFVGAQAGLVTCPYSEMREALKEMVAGADGVPHSSLGGPWAMDSDLPGGSYLFGTPTEETVGDWIALCRELDFNQIDFCGCLNYGDYKPFPKLYPNGYDSVRAVTDRLHDAGILAGLHTMSFSINKACSWVTPVPDPQLAKERSYTLAGDIDAACDVLPLVEALDDLPKHISYYVRRSMTLQIDDELIQYSIVNDSPPYSVAGCQRGALGTTAAPHRVGAKVHHLKECWGCFLPDGDSDLFGDVAGRIAATINECGFDFTYLDGLDGAHVIGGEENRWHYGTKFAFEVYKRLERPTMMEMATFHHHLWFIRSRMQAWDHTIRGHKTFIDLHCKSNEGCRRIFMPRHLGWSRVLAWVGHGHDVTFDDDVEYMWCKGLANDSGYSLQVVTPDMVAAEPWVAEVAPIIKTYETLRKAKYFPEEIKAKLRVPGKEFSLRRDAAGEYEFVPKQYLRHKVTGTEPYQSQWTIENEFRDQPLCVRIQALMGAEPYDHPAALPIAEFAEAGEFSDRGDTEVILNSGKTYCFPAAAPEMSAEVAPVDRVSPTGTPCGCWRAVNAGSAERVNSSSPDDRFSLLDHAERIYMPQVASWVRVGKRFDPVLDIHDCPALGVWIHGDGKGELMNFRLGSPSDLDTVEFDYYVTVDFTGWRYFEFIEPESERAEEYSWPYGISLYKQYRERFNFAQVGRLNLWYNNVPANGSVECFVSPIKALPMVENTLVNPCLTINGQTIVFPTEIKSGCYLEFRNPGNCKLYGPKREFLADVAVQGDVPTVLRGKNDISFGCAESAVSPRANVTLVTEGDTPLRR